MQRSKNRHILIVRLSAMGDVAMVASVLEQFCRQNPSVYVTMVTNTFYKPFFDHIRGVVVYCVDLKKRHKGVMGVVRLCLSLLFKCRFEMVLDLHDVIRSKVLRKLYKLAGKKIIVLDKGRDEKDRLTHFPDKKFQPLKTTIERYADCFVRAGFHLKMPSAPSRKYYEMPAQMREKIGLKKKTGKWYGVAPFAQHQGKIYPIHLMEQVIQQLCADPADTVFLFGGGKDEQNVTESIAQKYDNCISVISKLSLAEEIKLISHLDCMVSMDSSAMHIASLVGVRVVSVWGATHYYAGFLGYGQRIEDIVEVNLDCRPCSVYGNKPCFRYSYECMNAIVPQRIVDKVKQIQ